MSKSGLNLIKIGMAHVKYYGHWGTRALCKYEKHSLRVYDRMRRITLEYGGNERWGRQVCKSVTCFVMIGGKTVKVNELIRRRLLSSKKARAQIPTVGLKV